MVKRQIDYSDFLHYKEQPLDVKKKNKRSNGARITRRITCSCLFFKEATTLKSKYSMRG